MGFLFILTIASPILLSKVIISCVRIFCSSDCRTNWEYVEIGKKIGKATLLVYYVNAERQIPLRAPASDILLTRADGMEKIFRKTIFRLQIPSCSKY